MIATNNPNTYVYNYIHIRYVQCMYRKICNPNNMIFVVLVSSSYIFEIRYYASDAMKTLICVIIVHGLPKA